MEIANARSCCSWQRVHLLQGSPYFAGDNAENLGDIEDVNPCWAGVRDSESRRGCLKSQSENGKYFSLLDFDMQPRNNGALTICCLGIVVNIKNFTFPKVWSLEPLDSVGYPRHHGDHEAVQWYSLRHGFHRCLNDLGMLSLLLVVFAPLKVTVFLWASFFWFA